jgi:hypothetical protein
MTTCVGCGLYLLKSHGVVTLLLSAVYAVFCYVSAFIQWCGAYAYLGLEVLRASAGQWESHRG